MAGITTSETLSGEQPKDDNLGSRVDELTGRIETLEEQLSADKFFVDGELEELKSRIFPVLISVLESIEVLEKKNSDEK
jgi:hypothetical protein